MVQKRPFLIHNSAAGKSQKFANIPKMRFWFMRRFSETAIRGYIYSEQLTESCFNKLSFCETAHSQAKQVRCLCQGCIRGYAWNRCGGSGRLQERVLAGRCM